MIKIIEDNKDFTHEEALRFLQRYSSTGEQSVHRAIRRLLNDYKRIYAVMETIGCFKDEQANTRLKNTGSYSAFDEPYSVELIRKLIQEL